MNVRKGYHIIEAAAWDFLEDDALTLGAALAFYAALSMAPLVLILLATTSLLKPGIQEQIVQEIVTTMGPQAGNAVGEIVARGQEQQTAGVISTIVGFAVLLFSATGVFAQMQYSLNSIWEVRSKPGNNLWQWVRKRVFSLGMILGIAFLLLVSLAVTTAINLVLAGTSGYVWQAVNVVVSLLVAVGLFALIYKILPDVKITWRDVWAGAIITALLFMLGRSLVGLYLGWSTVGSSYGAAGSFVVILLWIYYASLILFLGAELTQTYVRFQGRRLEPEEHAEWTARAQAEQRQLQEANR